MTIVMIGQHTRTLLSMLIYAGGGYQHVVNHSEAAFTIDPATILGFDAGVVQNGGLVEEYPSAVDGARERHFFWVKVLEA